MSRFHEIISRFHEIICCFHHAIVCQLTLNLWQKQWYIQDSRQSFLQNMISCLPDNIQFSRDTISISRDIMMISNSRDSISFLKVIFLSIFFEKKIVCLKCTTLEIYIFTFRPRGDHLAIVFFLYSMYHTIGLITLIVFVWDLPNSDVFIYSQFL